MTPLTGRKVFVIAASAFGVIIAANVTLATQALRTFPGLEVANSYVASQGFDAQRQAQQALAWTLQAGYDAAQIRLRFTDAAGDAVRVDDLTLLVGRATEARDDAQPDLRAEGDAYVAALALAPGRWLLRVTARADDGTLFRQRVVITVADPAT